MVGIEHEGIHIGHLTVEGHACLIAAHLLHSAHILALCDDDGLSLIAE